MAAEEKMEAIRCEDHCIFLVTSLTKLYQNVEFIDCELDTDGGLLKGHKAILAASSPYLKKLLMDYEGLRRVPLKGVKYKDMKDILDYIYSGEVDLTLADKASFMSAAKLLQIGSLRSLLSSDVSEQFLPEVSQELCLSNCEMKSDGGSDLLIKEEDSLGSYCENVDLNRECDGAMSSVTQLADEATELETAKTSVTEKSVMDEDEKDSEDVLSFVPSADIFPAPVKSEDEADNQHDESDSEDRTLNNLIREHSYSCDNTTKKQNVEFTDIDNLVESRGSSHFANTMEMKLKECVVSLAGMPLQIIQPIQQMEIGTAFVFDQSSGILYKGPSPSEEVEEVGGVKRSSFEEEQEEKAYLDGPRDFSASSSESQYRQVSAQQDDDCPSPQYHASTSSVQYVLTTPTHAAQRRYSCDICPSSFSRKSALNRHVETHTGEKPYVCEICKKTFNQRSYLTAHMHTHGDEKRYTCSLCGAAFKRSQRLKLHMRSHSGEKPYLCNVCGKSYSLRHHLKRHTRSHTGEKPYVCFFCEKSFRDDGVLRAHMRTHTGEKPYFCSVCGKSCAQKSNLNIHMLIHTREKAHFCSICKKSFSGKVQLQNHMHTHTGEKPFLCSICGKSFTQLGALNVHTQTHTGEKPFLCSICGKSFRIQHHLKRHMRTHTGEKPFQCSVCKKLFNDKCNLKTHMGIHTGEKLYRCGVCKESFHRRSQLRKHVPTHSEGGGGKS